MDSAVAEPRSGSPDVIHQAIGRLCQTIGYPNAVRCRDAFRVAFEFRPSSQFSGGTRLEVRQHVPQRAGQLYAGVLACTER